MSEPLSSSEIEDVLSSIRRLVSEDMRPTPRGAASQPAGDKLILTPALRVVQTEGRLHLNLPPTDTSSPAAIEDLVAQVSAGVDQQSDQWESETGDLAPTAVEQVEPVVADAWLGDVSAQLAQDEWEAGDGTPADAGFDTTAAQDDLPEDDDIGLTMSEILHAPVPETVASPEELPGWAQEPDVNTDEDEVVSATPWSGGTIEPDQAWADEAEAAALEELTGAAPQHGADEFLLNDAAPLALDEEVLRELVRDIIREELQGRLGERITRNIRKLVRAEIARVMAADDLL